ncbi:thioredoxin domain-containing protein [Leisingera aquaemixtae]|jgi:thioredoxin 2|uniref:Thioredoxin-2 n=1 Tax=Leisingera aquaemixtae TaxID=1396826 RepID=A0A0P1HAE8_9RHOB|nr:MULTISPECIES: thioredoxin domain-containing protein [Leisingera]QDI74745.1 thiol reductase thioredoxin [Leisingera aquaemixtae]UWQ24142.1 thiol reductase thioredoxin [Leisingera aquaemixtae]UWQ36678.1 thiol reductase thioredoxin [Leisingera aquaemixtae]UWQ45045.1 thiol reductase thioredoxin [Leisingera aquaemixtae]CUI00280.1 Thioredoxin-2 [Leisingera aquaemixtae]
MGAKTLTCLSCAQLNRVPEDKLGRGPKCATCGAALLPGTPADVDPAILQKAVQNDDLPLVADFWAPWCGPCRSMAPEFAKAAKTLGVQARLVKLNTQDHPSAAARYRIRGIPALIAFERGKEKKRQAGAMRQGQIVSWLRG